jgi:hypothetical protein
MGGHLHSDRKERAGLPPPGPHIKEKDDRPI